MRALLIAAVLLTACGAPEAPAPPPDVTKEAWYGQAVHDLAADADAADKAFAAGKPDEAAALIEKAEPVEKQVLSVIHPTLAAMQAASALDDLYGRMLLSNKHYEWALFLFQKCYARWKYWQPQTDDTARRMKLAESEIAECGRLMTRATKRGRATKSRP